MWGINQLLCFYVQHVLPFCHDWSLYMFHIFMSDIHLRKLYIIFYVFMLGINLLFCFYVPHVLPFCHDWSLYMFHIFMPDVYFIYSCDRYKLYSIWGINLWIIYVRDIFLFCPCQIQKYPIYNHLCYVIKTCMC